MSGVIQLAVMDVVKSTAGVAVARALKLEDMLDFGDSFVLKNVSNGALYFAVSDAINGVSGAGSKLLNYDVYGSLDDIGFFSVTSMVAEKSGTDTKLYDIIRNTLSVSGDTAGLIAESAIVSGTRFLSDYIDSQQSIPSSIKAIRHPVSYVMGIAKI